MIKSCLHILFIGWSFLGLAQDMHIIDSTLNVLLKDVPENDRQFIHSQYGKYLDSVVSKKLDSLSPKAYYTNFNISLYDTIFESREDYYSEINTEPIIQLCHGKFEAWRDCHLHPFAEKPNFLDSIQQDLQSTSAVIPLRYPPIHYIFVGYNQRLIGLIPMRIRNKRIAKNRLKSEYCIELLYIKGTYKLRLQTPPQKPKIKTKLISVHW